MASINYSQDNPATDYAREHKPYDLAVFNYEGRPVGRVVSTELHCDGAINADVELYPGVSASDLITTPEMIRRRKVVSRLSRAAAYEQLFSSVTKEKTLSMTIEKVIFNPPATIIIWDDNTKTVVKTQEDEPYDPEKGMAMCIAKHIYGDCGSYYNVFSEWLKTYAPAEQKKATDEAPLELEGK